MPKNTSRGIFISAFGRKSESYPPMGISISISVPVSLSLWTGHLSLGSICAYPIGRPVGRWGCVDSQAGSHPGEPVFGHPFWRVCHACHGCHAFCGGHKSPWLSRQRHSNRQLRSLIFHNSIPDCILERDRVLCNHQWRPLLSLTVICRPFFHFYCRVPKRLPLIDFNKFSASVVFTLRPFHVSLGPKWFFLNPLPLPLGHLRTSPGQGPTNLATPSSSLLFQAKCENRNPFTQNMISCFDFCLHSPLGETK